MEITGQYRLHAPQEEVWKALNDPAVLKTCLPGCESLEKTSETEMVAIVKTKVGPISATFKGKVTLSDLNPPNGYKIVGEGSGGMAGFAKGVADVKLTEDGNWTTVLSYTATAQVGGKIAQIGSRLIDATAQQMADEFFSRFAKNVGVETPIVAAAADVPRIDSSVTVLSPRPNRDSTASYARAVPGRVWAALAVGIMLVLALVILIQ